MPRGKPYEPKNPGKVLAAYAQHKTVVGAAKALGGVSTKTLSKWLKVHGAMGKNGRPRASYLDAQALGDEPLKAEPKPVTDCESSAKSLEQFYRWACTGFAHGYIPILIEKLESGEF